MVGQLWIKNNLLILLNKIAISFIFISTIMLSSTHSMQQNLNSSLPPVFVLKNNTNGTTIYLLGTLHDAPLNWLSQPVIKLLTNANMLLIEHEIKNNSYYFHHTLTDIELKKYCLLNEMFPSNTEIAQKCMLFQIHINRKENTKSLKSVLESDSRKSLIERSLNTLSLVKANLHFNEHTLIAFDFNDILNYEVWLADLLLTCHLSIMVMKLTNTGMEKELLGHFKNKTIGYLETDNEIYNFMSKNQQIEGKYIDSIINLLQKITQIIAQADILRNNPHLTKQILGEYLDRKSYNIKFLKSNLNHPPSVEERNKKWVEIIERHLLSVNTILVAVGIGHLSSPNGLLSLLHKKGFQISVLDESGNESNPLSVHELNALTGNYG